MTKPPKPWPPPDLELPETDEEIERGRPEKESKRELEEFRKSNRKESEK